MDGCGDEFVQLLLLFAAPVVRFVDVDRFEKLVEDPVKCPIGIDWSACLLGFRQNLIHEPGAFGGIRDEAIKRY